MKWEFPLNNNAGEQGPNDEGIQNFRGTEFKALAREMCQNSLDAKSSHEDLVIMEFERKSIKVKDIPDIQGYKGHLSACTSYWKGNEEANKYLERCKKCIEQDTAYVLRVSDYKTTGLSGPYNEFGITSWKALVKISGAGNKGGEAGGSYGIGKKAAYLNSILRMVFYRTLTENGEKAAQGVVRTITFCKNKDDVYSKTMGIGYYGNEVHNSPVECIPELDKINERLEKGTDVFIYGFESTIEKKTWDKEIVQELINNFLLAIFFEKLNVKVKKSSLDIININSNTLGSLLTEYGRSVKDANFAYQVLTSDKTVEETYDFHGMGNLKLRLLIDVKQELNSKILISRKSKMTLFYLPKRKIDSIVPFTGILELEGVELNKFFRELETPSHDQWKPSLHKSDRKKAKEYYEELINWIKAMVRKHGYGFIEDQTDVEGLNDILQRTDQYQGKDNNGICESLDNGVEDIKFSFAPRKDKGIVKVNILGGTQKADGSKTTRGILNSEGNTPAIRTLNGEKKRKIKMQHTGKPNPQGKDLVYEKNIGERIEKLGKVRILKTSNSKYQLNINPGVAYQRGFIELNAVGENGRGIRLDIINAVDLTSNKNLICSNGLIQIESSQEEMNLKLSITTISNQDYAMEVRMYVHS